MWATYPGPEKNRPGGGKGGGEKGAEGNLSDLRKLRGRNYETGGYVGKVRHCKDCNYVGPLVVEADGEIVEAIKEEYEREKKTGKVGVD